MKTIFALAVFILAGCGLTLEEEKMEQLKEQLRTCCECLAASYEYQSTASCLHISIDSCANQAHFGIQCSCWDHCYTECKEVVTVPGCE